MSILAEHIVEVTKGAKDTYAGENKSDEILYGTTITESSDTYIVMAEDSETQEYIVDTYAESTENISGEYEYIPWRL